MGGRDLYGLMSDLELVGKMHGALQSASIFDRGPAESNRIWIWMED